VAPERSGRRHPHPLARMRHGDGIFHQNGRHGRQRRVVGITLQCRSHRFRDAVHLIAACELQVCGLSAAAVRVVAVVIRPDQSESLRWQQHGERVLYDSPWVTVTKVDVTPPDGNRFEHHAVHHRFVGLGVAGGHR